MQIDATEQPTPRSAEWQAGWDAGRAQEFKLASQVTRYRSQVDVAQEWLDIERDITAEMHREIEQAQKGREKAEAELSTARALLAELLGETGLKASYTAADGRLHPGATSTVADVWRFLWPEGRAK